MGKVADATEADWREYAVEAIADRLAHSRHVAIGASSPIPAAAALLAQHRNPDLRVSLLGDEKNSMFTDGGRELFDCAAQGRIDTFFLSGVQIDEVANINLVGTGQYPRLDQRFAGSFGSAYLYHLVPNIILFCWAHKPEVLVKAVDFISAAGPRDDGCFRPGGPTALVTNRCVFDYDAQTRRFVLKALFPTDTMKSVKENTGFDYLLPDGSVHAKVTFASAPPEATLAYMRTELADKLRTTYPVFAESLWPAGG